MSQLDDDLDERDMFLDIASDILRDRSDCSWKINNVCRRHIVNNECQPLSSSRCSICGKYEKNPLRYNF